MADRKGKAVALIKPLSRREQDGLKKKVWRFGESVPFISDS